MNPNSPETIVKILWESEYKPDLTQYEDKKLIYS
jgi:hypothetical protein